MLQELEDSGLCWSVEKYSPNTMPLDCRRAVKEWCAANGVRINVVLGVPLYCVIIRRPSNQFNLRRGWIERFDWSLGSVIKTAIADARKVG